MLFYNIQWLYCLSILHLVPQNTYKMYIQTLIITSGLQIPLRHLALCLEYSAYKIVAGGSTTATCGMVYTPQKQKGDEFTEGYKNISKQVLTLRGLEILDVIHGSARVIKI